MGMYNAMKAAVCISAVALFLTIPTTTAHADNVIPAEQGVAGIAYSLDNYYSTAPKDQSADKVLTNILKTEVLSPYVNLGVSTADKYVNVRKEASTESEVVGKLYRGCAADILEYLDDGWVKIKSGDVEGYIASDFLAIGRDAETMVDEYATKYAVVNTPTLRVREKQSTESSILTLIPEGEEYIVLKEHEEWAEILLGTDEDTGADFTGFVSKEHIIIRVEFMYAISIEEENRIKLEQEQAEQAEAERKQKLAQEEAERKEAAQKAAEKAEAAKNSKDKDTSNTSNSSNSSKSSDSSGSSNETINDTVSSSEASSVCKEIVAYAQKFVGNRYSWGGESLTQGADCSGFTKAVYADFGYSLPRVSRDQASSAGKKVSVSDIQPGDLVFYSNSSNVVNHVAIYIGNGMIVHAANSRQGIITSKYNYRDIYCVRRVIY
ncbi:MAG: NlpC/P60 family protein [Mobilitalea sp.]